MGRKEGRRGWEEWRGKGEGMDNKKENYVQLLPFVPVVSGPSGEKTSKAQVPFQCHVTDQSLRSLQSIRT